MHALVTGGSRGLGLAIARRLAENHYRVTLLARDRSLLERNVALLNETCPSKTPHDFIACDLGDIEGIEANIPTSCFETVSTLVNCAGETQRRLLVATKTATIEHIFKVNLIAPTILSRLFSRTMIRNKLPNSNILNVSSILAIHYLPGTAIYSSSKAALNTFSTNLAQELDRDGPSVRVNVLMPGLVRGTSIGESVNVDKMREFGLDHLVTTEKSVADAAYELIASNFTGQTKRVVDF